MESTQWIRDYATTLYKRPMSTADWELALKRIGSYNDLYAHFLEAQLGFLWAGDVDDSKRILRWVSDLDPAIQDCILDAEGKAGGSYLARYLSEQLQIRRFKESQPTFQNKAKTTRANEKIGMLTIEGRCIDWA